VKRLFDQDGAILEIFHDGEGEDAHIESRQDVEWVVEANKRFRNSEKKDWKNEHWELAAIIPNIFVVKWLNERGANVLRMDNKEFSKFIARELNDSDLRYLKTQDRRL
jgi:hypothetical protein